MTRLFALVLCLACAADEPRCAGVRELERELQATREQLAALDQLLWATRSEVARLGAELADARILTLVGGPPRRWRGPGVTCDGSRYLPGSYGEAAHRALDATGFCDPAEMPAQLAVEQ